MIIAHQTVEPGNTAWDNLDCDNDGVSNGYEIGDGAVPQDTDGDGTPDYRILTMMEIIFQLLMKILIQIMMVTRSTLSIVTMMEFQII